MNIKGPKGRGGYSAIVFMDGDTAVAEDSVGTIIKEESNAATVIQAAIDSCNKMGKIVLADLFDTTAEITLPSAPWNAMEGGLTIQGFGNLSGINYTPVTGYGLKLESVASNNQCAHHIIDNLVLKAPNTTNGVVGILGSVFFVSFKNVRVFNCPSGKGVYITYGGTLSNNTIEFENIHIDHCKYGIYALKGASLYFTGKGYIKTRDADNGKEAFYYNVDGYTGDGFKTVYTENLELLADTATQRAMYIKGDRYFFGEHHQLYIDAARPVYLDNGRHQFHSCYLGELDWSVGTLVGIDAGCRYCFLKAKDPMYCIDELKTPFRIDATSPFMYTDGVSANDAAAANGKCVELDAINEYVGLYFCVGSDKFNKYMGRGKYLLTIYAKDSAQVATDFKVYIQGSNGGAHNIAEVNYTLQATYNAIPHMFTLDSNDLEGRNTIFLIKRTSTANTISIDYISLQHVGTDFHQSLGGGYEFLHLPDAGTLPTASINYRGIVAFQPGATGVADKIKMCMKSSADAYSWKDVATG